MRKSLMGLMVLVAACTGSQVSQSKNDVLALEASLTTAGSLVVAYAQLPVCGAGAPTLCSTPAVVAKAGQAYQVAYVAVTNAQAVVDNVNSSASATSTAMTAASTAVSALTAIASTLQIK